MPQPKASLTKRVGAVIFLVAMIVLLATAAAFVAYEAFSFRKHAIHHLNTLSAAVAYNCAAALQFDNPQNGEEILAAVKADPAVLVAVLYRTNNIRFATYPRVLEPGLTPQSPPADGHTFARGTLASVQPVIFANRRVGTLFLRSSLSGLYAQFWGYLIIVMVVLAASLAVAFVLSNLLQRRISQPILALSATTRTIAKRGDYSLRAEKLTEDEVGVLTDSFNHMLDQIQQREQALRASEQALRNQLNLVNTITDNTPSCLWMLDTEGRCTFANPASEQVSGFKPEELVGKILHNLVHHTRPDGSPFPVEQCALDGLRKTGRPIQGHEDRFIHKDGRFYPVRCNARPITTDNKVVGTVMEVQDITDIVKAREAVAQHERQLAQMVRERTAELQDTVQQLETFSYTIVHDMRAPLRTMNSFATILMEEEGGKLSPEGREYVNRIIGGAKRLDALINDVLSYSRVSKGDASLEVVSLDDLVSNVIREYPDLHAQSSHIEVRRPLPRVIGNTALLTQCVSNLVGNALKFVPKDRTPQVTVRAEHRGHNVRLYVDDNGIGIAENSRRHLFELFHRLTASNEYPGTGVGLAIVKRAAERMNGSVGLESQPDAGSHFWIELSRA